MNEDPDFNEVKDQWHYKTMQMLSQRWFVFVAIPVAVMIGYISVFGIGELLVHTLATAQYTMMALIAYIISGSLTNRAESSKALKRAYDDSNPQSQLSSAIVFGVIIASRVVIFSAIAIAYTMFMTNSRAVV